MKPSWDKLMKKFAGHASALVGDVDCTAEDSKALCETHGVQGFPTIKWGSPDAMEDYEGGRDYEDLETFANENLKPVCSPANIDLCEPDKKEKIETLMKMSTSDLEAEIEKKDAELKEAETTFDEEVKKLQETYEGLEKAKTDKQKEIKESGLGLMKAVKAAKGSSGGEEL